MLRHNCYFPFLPACGFWLVHSQLPLIDQPGGLRASVHNSNSPTMSGEIRRENLLLLFSVAVYFHSFRACYSVSLWHRDITADRIKLDNDDHAQRTHLKSTELRPEVADPLPHFNDTELGRTGFPLDKRAWTVGASRRPRSSVSNSTDGAQADFTGWRLLLRLTNWTGEQKKKNWINVLFCVVTMKLSHMLQAFRERFWACRLTPVHSSPSWWPWDHWCCVGMMPWPSQPLEKYSPTCYWTEVRPLSCLIKVCWTVWQFGT